MPQLTDVVDEVGAGLDALDTPQAQQRGSRARTIAVRALPPVVALAVLLAIWQALWAAAIWPEYQLPSPLSVWDHVTEAVGDRSLFGWFWVSVHRAFIGFGISLVVAVPLGLLMANLPVLRRGIGPLVSGLQSLPSVAWVPAAILWFGLTDAAIYFVVLLGAVPSIANGLLSGIDQVPHNGMSLSDQSLVFFAILLIFMVGVGIELAIFRPLERSVLRARGLNALT